MNLLSLPLSLLHKCLLRGRTFSTKRQLTAALKILLGGEEDGAEGGEGGGGGGAGGSPTCLALWKLLVTIFSDVCPYKVEKEGSQILSLNQLFGLSLVAHADETFRLSPSLKDKVLVGKREKKLLTILMIFLLKILLFLPLFFSPGD